MTSATGCCHGPSLRFDLPTDTNPAQYGRGSRACQTLGGPSGAPIGRRAPIDTAAVPALIRLLADSRPVIRIAAAHALRAAGTDARPAVDALREASHDEDARVADAAAEAIEAIRLARPQR